MPTNLRLQNVNVLTEGSVAVKDVTDMQNNAARRLPYVILLIGGVIFRPREASSESLQQQP